MKEYSIQVDVTDPRGSLLDQSLVKVECNSVANAQRQARQMVKHTTDAVWVTTEPAEREYAIDESYDDAVAWGLEDELRTSSGVLIATATITWLETE